MSKAIRKLAVTAAGVALSLALAGPILAQSQKSLQDEISRSLTPTTPPPAPGGGLTRGLNVQRPDPTAVEQQNFINKLRTRSIAIEPTTPASPDAPPPASPNKPPPAVVIAPEERQKIADIVATKPKIDLEIFFDYNSWVVGPKALPALIALGNVLSNSNFKGTVFFINGYTDARGSPEYNQVLSQHRADAVRRILIDQYHLAPDTLIAVGFGKEQLKLPDQPYADQNRRVQIVNTEMKGATN